MFAFIEREAVVEERRCVGFLTHDLILEIPPSCSQAVMESYHPPTGPLSPSSSQPGKYDTLTD